MIEVIKAAGYEVYMRHITDKYCYYTDGLNIGYAQWGFSMRVCTVHKANTQTGTGFSVAESITDTSLAAGLAYTPYWASISDIASVKKYANIAAFIASNSFNNEFKRI